MWSFYFIFYIFVSDALLIKLEVLPGEVLDEENIFSNKKSGYSHICEKIRTHVKDLVVHVRVWWIIETLST